MSYPAPAIMNDMALGIILGLGIPYLVFMTIVLRRCFCPNCWNCISQKHDDMSLIRLELSPEAYSDFMSGRLTSKLHGEITHLYALKGDLSAYKRIAKKLKHAYLAEFLQDPTRHPLVIHALFKQSPMLPLTEVKVISE